MNDRFNRVIVLVMSSTWLVGCGQDAAGGTRTDAGAPASDDGGTATGDAALDPAPDGGEAGPSRCDEEDCESWCSTATWGGEVPDETTDVVIPEGTTVVVDCDAVAGTLQIEEGGELVASREASSTLEMHGNLVVRGRLDYGTATDRIPSSIRAEIVFHGVDDDAFQGTPSALEPGSDRKPSGLTPMEVLDSDVGIWVMGRGELTAAGARKASWGFLVEGAGPGDRTFEVEDASGWSAGDRVVLTPSARRAEEDWHLQFTEGTVDSVDGDTVTIEGDPDFEHAGCTDCMRRAEAINLTRNVVIRSADDEGHAHVMIAEQGKLQLDSVELRWLGPEQCGGPERRSALYFHQQEDASRESFVRHSAIWGGDHGVLVMERSHGITLDDVAGYDTHGSGFAFAWDRTGCGTRCTDKEESTPRDSMWTRLIAAKLRPATRESGCARIDHRMAGFKLPGKGGGVVDSVAVGVGGRGKDIAGFTLGASGGTSDFMERNISHNNGGHGFFFWLNVAEADPYPGNVAYSNENHGIHWGAYTNSFVLEDFTAVDNGVASIGVKAVPRDDRPRLHGGTIDDIRILSYVVTQEHANIIKDMEFTGDAPVGVTQVDTPCTDGNPEDPDDPDCLRVWLRFVDPVFPSGMKPFLFGDAINRHAVWEVRGFSHPDYLELPEDFDLYRRDNEVEGGGYHEDFDAWLVPR